MDLAICTLISMTSSSGNDPGRRVDTESCQGDGDGRPTECLSSARRSIILKGQIFVRSGESLPSEQFSVRGGGKSSHLWQQSNRGTCIDR
jgi:hypothetical protein